MTGATNLNFHVVLTLIGSPYALLPSETSAVASVMTEETGYNFTFQSQQYFSSGVAPAVDSSHPTSACLTSQDFSLLSSNYCSTNCQAWVQAGAGSSVAPQVYTYSGAGSERGWEGGWERGWEGERGKERSRRRGCANPDHPPELPVPQA